MSGRAAQSIVLACLLSLSACSQDDRPSVYPADITGQVTLDGAPLRFGTLAFIPETAEEAGGRPGIAAIGADGHYRVGNANPEKPAGLKPGAYRVTVLAMVPNPSDGSLARLAIPERYSDPQSTPFEIQVNPGPHSIDFALSSTPGGAR